MGKDLQIVMPDAWPVFFHRRNPLPIQLEAMPYVLRGHNVLISSPTASGKTEAVMAPLYQRHVSFRRTKLAVVYIAPTKALANDIYFRMGDYLGGIGALGGVHRYTGDHHNFSSPDNAFVLITTPEALDSLQLTRPQMLKGTRAVVIDEIHFLHGTARGQQLRYVLARLNWAADHPLSTKDVFQLIALSATVHDASEVKNLWLGEGAVDVITHQERNIEMTYLQATDASMDKSAPNIANLIRKWMEETETSKVLIFANSRNDAHILSIALAEKFKDTKCPVFLHIGILSGSERDRIECEMKSGKNGICVATSTLEIGIDIGDIEAVVLLSPPRSTNAFLQRIGRGNRKSSLCRVVAFFRNAFERMVYEAISTLAQNGELDESHEYDRPSVRFQQVLSLAWQCTRKEKPLTKESIVNLTGGYGHADVINDMIEMGHLKQIGNLLLPSDEIMDEGDSRQIHTVIGTPSVREMIDAKTGEVMAQVTSQIHNGIVFLGGQIRTVDSKDKGRIFLEPSKSHSAAKISKLPSTRYKGGFSQQIVWQIAKQLNRDPRIWERTGARIITSGGMVNNKLLSILCKLNGINQPLEIDDFGIAGITEDVKVTPDRVYQWMSNDSVDNIPSKDAQFFREPTRYYSKLSNKLKKLEALNSVPVKHFKEWIEACQLRR